MSAAKFGSEPWVAAALAGWASGARTFTALAALAVTEAPHHTQQPDRALSSLAARVLVSLSAVGELIWDKLPQTPSRLEAFALTGRIVTAAGCGLLFDRRHRGRWRGTGVDDDLVWVVRGRQTVLTAAFAGAAAAFSAVFGVRWRTWASGRLGSDLPGALIEDALAILAARAAARRT